MIFDHGRWKTALSWRERLSAVSWPRASIVGGLIAVTATSLWLFLQPTGIRAHAPRLPTEQEWRANQVAAKAMEADLSPALAAANRSEQPGRVP